MTIQANQRDKCPHCGIVNRFENINISTHGSNDGKFEELYILAKEDEYQQMIFCRCTNCKDIIIFWDGNMIYPLGSCRGNAPQEVPKNIAQDFNEACLVEPFSKKASAALARRCLQVMLRDQGISPGDLSQEIEEAMKTLPTHLRDSIDAIRNIGNFAVHPNKSKQTGEIIDVESGETEWILDVLEDLFDLYYVSPAKTKAKKDLLNIKLSDTGKPPLK